MKKTVVLILALVLAACFASAAFAADAETGVFAAFADDEFTDPRVPALDEVAEKPDASLVADPGLVFTLSQGYYTGDRVFISYRVSPATDLIALHDGVPSPGIRWDIEDESWVVGSIGGFGFPDTEKAAGWLDGKSQHWLEFPQLLHSEYLELEDGTRLDFIMGVERKQPDGSVIGWQACDVPAEKAADTLAFRLPLTGYVSVRFQDYTTYREAFGEARPYSVPFTLRLMEDTVGAAGIVSVAD